MDSRLRFPYGVCKTDMSDDALPEYSLFDPDSLSGRDPWPELGVRIQGDSAHAVAYALLAAIARFEGKIDVIDQIKADRKWVITTFTECYLVAHCIPLK